jgi:CubicO group peptidase (beta-lactamase class C family)
MRNPRPLAFLLCLLVPACESRPPRIEHAMRDLLPQTRVKGRTYTPATVEQRMAERNIPAVSVAVIDDGRIAWTKAWGLADVGEQRKATTDTLFQAASISKPVAASAALALVDDGRLALDEDVNARLRSWKVPPSRFREKVTLRRLLSHTAGLTVHGFPGYAPGGPVPASLQILDGVAPANTKPVRVDLEPGSAWRYSGGGYVVLQTLLSDVTGRTFPELMRERVFARAGMRASTYEQPIPASLRSRAATAYHGDGKAVAGKHAIHPEMAAAGLWTTPSDLARWVLALDELLAPATLEAMFTKGKGDFGLGIAVRGRGDDLEVSHSGTNEGFRCTFVYYPERGEGAVIMTNSDQGATLTTQLMHALAREFDWDGYGTSTIRPIQVPPAELQQYAGTYPVPDMPMEVVIAVRSGTVLMNFNNNHQEIVPVGKDEFESVEGGRMRFVRDASGRVAALSLGGLTLPRRTDRTKS